MPNENDYWNEMYQAAIEERRATEKMSDANDIRLKTARELDRPFYKLRPKIFREGNEWCVLYGQNIQEGIVGFGGTPEKASAQFDIAWLNEPAVPAK